MAAQVAVSSLQEIMELMNKGNLYRTTEATNCNEVSSRSHAVLQINCVGVEKYTEARKAKRQQARLSMIDLAGSERAYKTDNTGQRLREGRIKAPGDYETKQRREGTQRLDLDAARVSMLEDKKERKEEEEEDVEAGEEDDSTDDDDELNA